VETQIEDPERRELDHQIARIGWALLFIMTGCLLLLPGVPQGTWLIGIGVILLGAQLVRYLNRIPTWTFSLILGAAALLLGVAAFAGYVISVELFPIVLILIGLSIVLPSHLGGEHAHQPAAV
jgi:hypothetical protein